MLPLLPQHELQRLILYITSSLLSTHFFKFFSLYFLFLLYKEHLFVYNTLKGCDYMDLINKINILSAAAKFDVACTSSGSSRSSSASSSCGNTVSAGICHSFSADGRCVSLLKVLLTNACIYDCKYCVNRISNDTPRASFTPRELAELTMNFYKRNYIEGLFLSSAVVKNPDYTCEKIIETLRILREEFHFGGYIHAKAIPGASEELISRIGLYADRMSVNIELPSQASLQALAPDKSKSAILSPMKFISSKISQNSYELTHYRRAEHFAPAGQSTQMIVGASPETDYQILTLSAALYKKYALKRVFYSAYVPVSDNPLLPALDTKPPLLREHRLYQADWLLRFYGFSADEILSERSPNFNPLLDPKCNWAVNHPEFFPLEINSAPYEALLRVPGVGVRSAKRILAARKVSSLDFSALKKLGVVLKRAQYFITCKGKVLYGLNLSRIAVQDALISQQGFKAVSEGELEGAKEIQTSLLGDYSAAAPYISAKEEALKCITGQM